MMHVHSLAAVGGGGPGGGAGNSGDQGKKKGGGGGDLGSGGGAGGDLAGDGLDGLDGGGDIACSSLEEIREWGSSFDRLMHSAAGRKLFREFLVSEYSEENIAFWLACEQLKLERNPERIEEKARYIYEDYISILSPKEVSIPCQRETVLLQTRRSSARCPCLDDLDSRSTVPVTSRLSPSYPRTPPSFHLSIFLTDRLSAYIGFLANFTNSR